MEARGPVTRQRAAQETEGGEPGADRGCSPASSDEVLVGPTTGLTTPDSATESAGGQAGATPCLTDSAQSELLARLRAENRELSRRVEALKDEIAQLQGQQDRQAR